MPSKQLPAASREFLHIVSQASFINPFSDEFAIQQQRIANCDASVSEEDQVRLMVGRWNDHLHALTEAGVTNLKQVTGEDCELLQYAFLYEIYHRFLISFDELITNQMEAGTRPVVVPFASKALALFRRRGFETADARRYFAIFYQIRRAYYFIDRGLIGRSPCMRQLRLHLWNNVFTHNIRWYELHLWNRMEDFSTMLLGETGTGKGAAAAAIGRSGFIPFDEKRDAFTESFTRGFVSLNLSQFPETLIESELFGHKKGAFTGAMEDHEGVLSRCSPHGAIFLDEIGDATIPVQIKLLQVLQERTFWPSVVMTRSGSADASSPPPIVHSTNSAPPASSVTISITVSARTSSPCQPCANASPKTHANSTTWSLISSCASPAKLQPKP